MGFVLGIGALLILLFVVAFITGIAKHKALEGKYAQNPNRDLILTGKIRTGMTVEELIDSWGRPEAIDERVLKTKVVHTYKYARTGARSFRQRVKVEDGIVVGWTNS